MRMSTSTVVWEGGSPDGSGTFTAESGAFSGDFTFGTRFGEDPGTNPEELLAAAHAACLSMALAHAVQEAGHRSERIEVRASCTVDKANGGFRIQRMELDVGARVPGIDASEFQRLAEGAKEGCPVSNALKGNLDIALTARLEE